MPKIAIIAALEREVWPLVSGPGWRRTGLVQAPSGCFESASAVVVCAGIGGGPASSAVERLLQKFQPAGIVSAGLAGAVVPELKVGSIFVPATVLDTSTKLSLSIPVAGAEGILVSASSAAGAEGKRLLGAQYGAQAVDMEAGAVGKIAQLHGIPFLAVKAISDEYDFPMPDLQPYISSQGQFQTAKFVLAIARRPACWGVIRRLRANTLRAARQLCRRLQPLVENGSLDWNTPSAGGPEGASRSRTISA